MVTLIGVGRVKPLPSIIIHCNFLSSVFCGSKVSASFRKVQVLFIIILLVKGASLAGVHKSIHDLYTVLCLHSFTASAS